MREGLKINNSDTEKNSMTSPVENEGCNPDAVKMEESLTQDKKNENLVDKTNETDASIPDPDPETFSEQPAETSRIIEGNDELQERDSRIRQLETELETLKKEHMHEMERNRGEVAELKVLSNIKDAAVRCGFIDPSEAALHLKDIFRISAEGILFKGKRVKDSDLGKIIAAAVRNLSDAKPHLIRFEYKSGSGALKTGTVVEAPVSRRDFSDLRTKREYEEELKKRGIQPLNPV
jgi:hypothetical protein